MVLVVAGARLGKTSNCAEPESVDGEAPPSSTKCSSQVIPLAARGMSKVASVVTSLTRPFLKILPAPVLKLTAPVHTLYCEMVVGTITPEPLGMEDGVGTAVVKPRMAAAMAVVRNCILMLVGWWGLRELDCENFWDCVLIMSDSDEGVC